MNERVQRTAAIGQSRCPNPACGRAKRSDKAFCLPCWRMIPHWLQRKVWDSYIERDMLEHINFLNLIGRRLADGVGEWPDS